jgi:hypothetical protein
LILKDGTILGRRVTAESPLGGVAAGEIQDDRNGEESFLQELKALRRRVGAWGLKPPPPKEERKPAAAEADFRRCVCGTVETVRLEAEGCGTRRVACGFYALSAY